MKSIFRRLWYGLLSSVWLRQGANRRVPLGPYRGLYVHLSPPLRDRLRIFYAAYEPEVTHWLAQHVKPGMTVYNAGAHVGIHALYIAQLLNSQGRLFAFEGWPENFDALKANIDLNQHLNVEMTPVQMCIARESGIVTMAQGSSDGKHHIADAAETGSEHVPSISFDDFAGTNPLPDFIMIDIEGYELDALEGGESLLAQSKPLLLIEHHEQVNALTTWLQARGYQVNTLARRHLVAQ